MGKTIVDNNDGDFISMKDYLGEAGGPDLGRALAQAAVEARVVIKTRAINAKGFSEVKIYPKWFLEDFFNKKKPQLEEMGIDFTKDEEIEVGSVDEIEDVSQDELDLAQFEQELSKLINQAVTTQFSSKEEVAGKCIHLISLIKLKEVLTHYSKLQLFPCLLYCDDQTKSVINNIVSLIQTNKQLLSKTIIAKEYIPV